MQHRYYITSVRAIRANLSQFVIKSCNNDNIAIRRAMHRARLEKADETMTIIPANERIQGQ